MTKPVLVILALICFLCPPEGVLAFDRDSAHQAAVGGLDLRSRQADARILQSGAVLSPSFTDVQMSDINYAAHYTQDHVSLLPLSGGNWLTAWEDSRYGANKILWQLLSSTGTAIGSNTLVAGSSIGDDLADPLLMQDVRGKVYLLYRDRTAGELYAVRYNSNLTIDHAPILINDTTLGAYAGPFDAALFTDGRLVVVWEEYGPSNQTINMKILDSSGATQLGPVAAPSDAGTTQRWAPSVAIDPLSGFVIAWEDYRNGQADIYARQFTGAGSAVGTDFSVVPPPYSSSAQYAPKIAFCGADMYVIGWLDRRSGQEVYIQQFSPTTGLVGANRLVSTADTLTTNWDLNLCVAPAGTLSVTWGAFGLANNIMSQRFGAGLVAIGTPSARNVASTGRRWSPSTECATNQRYGIGWTEYQNEGANINLMLFDTAAIPVLSQELRLNDDQFGAPSANPSICAGTDWYDLVAFESRRNDAGDIFCQAISAPGIRPDYNQKVSQDPGENMQSEPAITSGNGKSLVVWVDSRPLAGIAGQRIYGRYGSSIGYFTDNEFCLSDTIQAAVKSSPKVAMTPSGRALTVWLDKRSGNMQVWGRWLAVSGALDGSEFQISNPISDTKNAELNLSTDSVGRFYVTWLDRGTASPTAKCHWYNADKSAGGSFFWSPDFGVNITDIAVDNFPNGNIGILWTGLNGNVSHMYLDALTPAGSVVWQLLDIADNPPANVSQPALSIAENGYICATWADWRTGRRNIMYQLYDGSVVAVGGNQPVSSATPEYMTSPAVKNRRGRAWFTWVDPRANGDQVYIANSLYLPTDVNDPGSSLPTEYRLAQNYPNPFNPSTTIEFSLPKTTAVTLSVVNLLGQEVAVLVDHVPYSAGIHRVVWDGRDQSGNQTASGVYFYRLTAGDFTEQRKMMLVK
ncbi:MAG: T9SS type A sorting domain-containing protein [candidate division Zixibacteria bacterium]|nr:T9SS type A sorting domain-containing protein [candidate division Zixibacteria bacterium]